MMLPLLMIMLMLMLPLGCRTPIAGPSQAVTRAETKTAFLARRAQDRGVTPAQQTAWDHDRNATAEVHFDLTDLALATSARGLYQAHCAGCHQNLTGPSALPPSAPRLGGFGFRMGMMMSGGKMARALFRHIRDGKGSMPAFKDQLANEQIWLLVRLLRTF